MNERKDTLQDKQTGKEEHIWCLMGLDIPIHTTMTWKTTLVDTSIDFAEQHSF